MSSVKLTLMVVLVCALMAASTGFGYTLAECEANFYCTNVDGTYKLSSVADNCVCCLVDSAGTTTAACMEAASNGGAGTASSTATGSGSAPQCTAPHCTTCNTSSATSCSVCESGYYVSEGSCVLNGGCAVPNCAQCMLADATKCSVCVNGYMTTSNYTCATNAGSSGAAAVPRVLLVAAATVFAVVLCVV